MAASAHKPPTMSKSALLLGPCLAWAGPAAQWYEETRVDTEDLDKRDLGILFHRAADRHAKELPFQGLPEALRKPFDRAKDYLAKLSAEASWVKSEAAIAVNWSTGDVEELICEDRKYPDTPGYQNGTADLVAFIPDPFAFQGGTLLVADWKTGSTDGSESQLLSLACGFKKLHSCKQLDISCLFVNDEGVWEQRRTVSDDEIQCHWDAMRFQWEDIGKRNTTVPGIHCTQLYCPHLAYCPSITAATTELGRSAEDGDRSPAVNRSKMHLPLTDKPNSATHAGHVMAMLSAARRQIKYLESGLKEYVEKTGGKVIADQYEWADGNNGWRWRRIK